MNRGFHFRFLAFVHPPAYAIAVAVGLVQLSPVAQGKVRPGEFFTYDEGAKSLSVTFAPLLNNDASSAASVSATLTTNQAEGRPLAVRVRAALNNEAAVAIFDDFPIEYVFCDVLDEARVPVTREIGEQVLQSAQSQRAYVGNFNVYPNGSIDPTIPATLPAAQAPRFQIRANSQQYGDQRAVVDGTKGKQVAMPSLLPGAPDFRNPVNGNSGAPNIRSACFVLPIQRITLAQLGLLGFTTIPTGGQAHKIPNVRPTSGRQLVPVVARFNNFGNAGLDSDGNSANGYAFIQNVAPASNGQLMSRGDFSALVLHYRLRGADSVAHFGGDSVVGYSDAQTAADIDAGWNGSEDMNAVFDRKNYSFANLKITVGDLGDESDTENPRNAEIAGLIWSGVYDRIGSRPRRLVILLSNMSSLQKTVDFPKIGGMPLKVTLGSQDQDNRTIAAGQHLILTFAKVGQTWELLSESFVFLDNNRNGIGTGASDPP